jgi:hypothetical protein
MVKKILKNLTVKGTYFNTVEAIYDKVAANIILNREKLKVYNLRSGIRYKFPLSLLLINVVL